MSKKPFFEYRDVSLGLQMLRDFLLGRKYNLHNRFPPGLSPRSVPPPDIPRGPDDKYSKQYYYKRSAYETVRPPVIAPVAEGPAVLQKGASPKSAGASGGGMPPDTVCFPCCPVPGTPWWWDGHCYYDCVPDPEPMECEPPPPCDPCPPPCPPMKFSTEEPKK